MFLLFFVSVRGPLSFTPTVTLFPYTTLFRSGVDVDDEAATDLTGEIFGPRSMTSFKFARVVMASSLPRSRSLERRAQAATRFAIGACTLSMPDRKSTRLTPVTNAHLVCRRLLEKKNTTSHNTHVHDKQS